MMLNNIILYFFQNHVSMTGNAYNTEYTEHDTTGSYITT